jgi:hypothetical protein
MIVPGKVSVVIPSRKEKFLVKTIEDVLSKARGEVDVTVCLDGYWPDEPIQDRPNLHFYRPGVNIGMRAGINACIGASDGEFIMKLDGHCMVDEGFDIKLKADCEENMLMVPRRYRLEPEEWKIVEDGRLHIDYHFLSYPFARPDDVTCGLHGEKWDQRTKERLNKPEFLIDDEMSSQGSCYFLKRDFWKTIGPLDDENYGTFAQEFQEVGMRAWLSGGRVVVNKKTWYAHLHKGSKYGTGYGFTNDRWKEWAKDNAKAHQFTVEYWLGNKWAQRVRDFEWLIDHFWPVPGWPEDYKQKLTDYREERLNWRGQDANTNTTANRSSVTA